MKYPKTYRGFYIEEDEMGFRFNESELFGEGTKWEGSIHDVYLKIDDIIIERQLSEITGLRIGLLQVLGAARASRDILKNLGIQSDLLNVVIEDNERLIKQLES